MPDPTPEPDAEPLDPEQLAALVATRQSLHAVAESILAGHQHRTVGTIRLRTAPGGFSTGPLPNEPLRLAVRGTDLVVTGGAGERSVRLSGSLGELAAFAGVDFGPPVGVYPPGAPATAADDVQVDGAGAALISRGFSLGQLALNGLAAGTTDPVLWPEHFDLGVSLGEVNYGVSAGDSAVAEPYAYVGPWMARTGAFWNQPFGAARLVRTFPDSAALLAWFELGRKHAAEDA